MADAVEALVRALAAALGEDADATAIADALWLAAAPAAGPAASRGDLPEPAPSDTAGDAPESPSAPGTDTPAPPLPAEDADANVLYESLPQARPAPGAPVSVPGGRDLPRAMEVRRALRPFKRRHPQGRRSALNLDATVRDFRRTGELTPVLTPAPEPWFELLLVIDASPSMAVWKNTNAEFTALLAGLGAFRGVRTWSLRPGADPVVTDHQGRRVAPGQAVSSDGRRLVLVLSDCVAPGWRRPETWQLLRGWGAKGPVALLNPLPDRLWHRTGLDLPAIRVRQRGPTLRNTDLTFQVPLLLRTLPDAEDADWQALPTLTFSPYSLARWAETFMRGAPHGYDAVLVPRTGIMPSLSRTPNAGPRSGPDPTEAFLRTASPSAVRLAVLCSPFGRLSLPLMHLIRQRLLPEASVGDLAELLTSPVVTIQTYEEAPPVVRFDDVTRERLASRLSRRDAWLTYDALSRHIAARSPGGAQDIQAIAASGPDSVPPSLYPFARASDELLTLLRESEPVRPAPWPDLPEAFTTPAPSRGLPDPARSAALLIGVSYYPNRYSLPGVERGLAAMRSYLTSSHGWNLPDEHCTSLVNPATVSEVLAAVTRACDAADTVLLYFGGGTTVDSGGQTSWLLAGEERDDLRPRLEFDRIAPILAESRSRHVMVVLDQDNGTAASRALENWDLHGRTGQRARGMQVLFVDRARNNPNGEPLLTQELLRIAAAGVRGGPEFLDLPAIAEHMHGPKGATRPQARFIVGDPSRAFARNRAWEPQDPVQAVYEQVRRRLQSALPRTYRGAYRHEADQLLLALLAFAEDFIDGSEQAGSETALADAVQFFLGRRGLSTERETPGDSQRVDLLWPSQAGTFGVHIASDEAARSWNAISRVDFELVLEREGRSTTSDLATRVSTIAIEDTHDGAGSCLVTMRLPTPYFEQDPLAAAVESACGQLLGEPGGDLNGVELPGLTDVTIQGVTPDPDSIVWDTVEEYDHGLALGHVTVNAELVLVGVDAHMEEVSVELEVQLTFDARRESADIELEFRGTNPQEPHPHEPM
ncbi:SAV_2336 N-terminal domain-related protein [Streptomyces sp. NPDC046915]|uniref:SAV_2336 N-terminal domain-related protein n=1 Tax=Streptomyces sp. NPDC046915 TaxID=3155257 RepID=UPI0033E0750D